MKIEWLPIETAVDKRLLLLFQGGYIASGERRYGRLGEPQQDVMVWRCDCCGRFGNPVGWARIELGKLWTSDVQPPRGLYER